jgi:hypothetical protein
VNAKQEVHIHNKINNKSAGYLGTAGTSVQKSKHQQDQHLEEQKKQMLWNRYSDRGFLRTEN